MSLDPVSCHGSQEHVPAAGIKPEAPVVGLVLQKSHINTKDECHYVALIAELEARGAKVRATKGGNFFVNACIQSFFSFSCRLFRGDGITIEGSYRIL